MQIVSAPLVLYSAAASERVRARQRKLAAKLEAKSSSLRWVYALGCGQFVKFGQALNFDRRLKAYATHSPYDVRVLAKSWVNADYEFRILAALQQHRHRGEWFVAHDDVLEMVVALAEGPAQLDALLKQ